MTSYEVNFDGIAGPTHYFGGLSFGNVASMKNKHLASNPKKAALQCLKKMKLLHDMGIIQAIMPPQERPHFPTLRRLGFSGSDEEIAKEALKKAPHIFFSCCSSSFMWTANAATITPSADTQNGVQITPANLHSSFHRSIETDITAELLKRIFPSEEYFKHHLALPSNSLFADEGAANHTRFCQEYGSQGIHLFVYGKKALTPGKLHPKLFPARQTIEASQAIVRQHKINPDFVFFAQQNPEAIDKGVFHNDVASVGNKNVLFFHEEAFVNGDSLIQDLQMCYEKLYDDPFCTLKVLKTDLSLQEAVETYLFNSQIVQNKRGNMSLIAPIECEKRENIRAFIEDILRQKNNPLEEVFYVDLKESMQNGGGPACLRLRIVLNENELKEMHQGVLFTDQLYLSLNKWIDTYYPESLDFSNFSDPQMIKKNKETLDKLTQLLGLGSIYSFQK